MLELIQSCGFDWDAANRGKCQKHGVSIEEIEALFRNAPLYVTPDHKHSGKEVRYVAAGQSKGRFLFVAFTLRAMENGQCIRPISARFMHKKESRRYEQEST